MNDPVQDHPELTADVIKIYHKQYVQAVSDIVCKINPPLDANLISLSEHAIGQALAEANKDIKAMQQRRQFKNGISASKIAGIVTFRLVRWTPVQLHSPQCENENALKINFMAAFAFALKHILNVNIIAFPTKVTREFQYNIARRHTNQETLGLAYEMLEYHIARNGS